MKKLFNYLFPWFFKKSKFNSNIKTEDKLNQLEQFEEENHLGYFERKHQKEQIHRDALKKRIIEIEAISTKVNASDIRARPDWNDEQEMAQLGGLGGFLKYSYVILDYLNNIVYVQISEQGTYITEDTFIPFDLVLSNYKNEFVTYYYQKTSDFHSIISEDGTSRPWVNIWSNTYVKIKVEEIPKNVTSEYLSDIIGFKVGPPSFYGFYKKE